MNNILTGVTVLCFFMFGPVSNLFADNEEVSGQADINISSNYVWRGQKLSDRIVVQPSIGITYGGFGANLWANYDMNTNEHTETDLTLNYEFSLDKLFLDGGYIYYAVDGSGSSETQEIYLSVGYEVIASPAISFYYDFDEGDGAFISLSIGHCFDLFKENIFNLGATIGYNINNSTMGTDKNKDDFNNFYNGEISASVTIPVIKAIIVTPMLVYTFPLSNDGKNAIKGISFDEDTNIFYGGITAQLIF